TAGETATVNPDHHGTSVIGVLGAGPNVSVEAIFAARGLARRSCSSRRRSWSCRPSTAAAARRSGRTCNTWGSECVSLAHAVPLRSRLRRAPAVLTERRRCERNSFEDAHTRLTCAYRTGNQARFDPYLFRNLSRGVRDGCEK